MKNDHGAELSEMLFLVLSGWFAAYASVFAIQDSPALAAVMLLDAVVFFMVGRQKINLRKRRSTAKQPKIAVTHGDRDRGSLCS